MFKVLTTIVLNRTEFLIAAVCILELEMNMNIRFQWYHSKHDRTRL